MVVRAKMFALTFSLQRPSRDGSGGSSSKPRTPKRPQRQMLMQMQMQCDVMDRLAAPRERGRQVNQVLLGSAECGCLASGSHILR